MTIYSSDGEVYDTPLHHELEMPQSMLQPAEEGPVRVAGKKSYEPPPIKKPPTLPPLEPLTDPGNPPRGQYGPPGIEYPPWTVERPFAMNDNTPPLPLDITMPNIAGGLRQPPKPANDNDSRKPMKMSSSPVDKRKEPTDPISDLIEKDQLHRDMDSLVYSPEFPAYIMSPSSDLEDVKPSKNIEHRSSSDLNYATVAKDILNTALFNQPSLKETGKLRKDIGLKDLDKSVQEGIDRTKLRKYGRGILIEEGERRFREDFPDVADEIIKRYRKSQK